MIDLRDRHRLRCFDLLKSIDPTNKKSERVSHCLVSGLSLSHGLYSKRRTLAALVPLFRYLSFAFWVMRLLGFQGHELVHRHCLGHSSKLISPQRLFHKDVFGQEVFSEPRHHGIGE